METPPASPRLQSTDAVAARLFVRTPPPPPKAAPLSRALLRGSPEMVARALDDDPVAAVVPLNGCEPPLVYAVKQSCPITVLELLIERGADVNDIGNLRLTALEVVAGTKSVPDPLVSFHGSALPNLPVSPFIHGTFEECGRFENPLMLVAPMLVDSRTSRMPCEAMDYEGHLNMVSEAYRHKCAVLLLRHGAKPMRAAEIAEQAGRMSLAALVKHWSGMEARKLLEAHWHRWDQGPVEGEAPSGGGCSLLRMPSEPRQRLSDFLAPADCQILASNHSIRKA